MNKLHYTVLILFLILVSCNSKENKKSKKEEFVTLLTSDSVKYWEVVNLPDRFSKQASKKYPYFWYSFNKNGEMKFYSLSGNKRAFLIGSDADIPNKWREITDSSIVTDYDTVKIIKLTTDTFKYYNKKKGLIILSKSSNQSALMDTIEDAPPLLAPL